MLIFFSFSPRARSFYEKRLEKVGKTLAELGHHVIRDLSTGVSVSEFYTWKTQKRRVFYNQIISSIKKADLCIYEVSFPSIGMGHLITKSLDFGKNVIALYTMVEEPYILSGAANENVLTFEYREEHLKKDMRLAIKLAQETSGKRYHLFFPQVLHAYLEWKAKSTHMPKSVIIRKLVEESLENDQRYLVRS